MHHVPALVPARRPAWLSSFGGAYAHHVPLRVTTEPEAMMAVLALVFKLIKWTVITVAYLLVGLAKLVTIIVVLIFFTSRAGIRRLLDAKERSDDDDSEEYDLGYPSPLGRSSGRLTRDAFDARWQRERDLRVAGRRSDPPDGSGARAYTSSSGERRVD